MSGTLYHPILLAHQQSTFKSRLEKHDFSSYLIEFTVYYVVFILVVFLSQVFLVVFRTICTVLFYFSVSCFVTVWQC